MAAFDAHAVLADLEAFLLTREGWGTRVVLTEIADLRAKHRVADRPLEQLLRTSPDLRVTITTTKGNAPDEAGGTPPTGSRDASPPSEVRGGHDGRDEHPHPDG